MYSKSTFIAGILVICLATQPQAQEPVKVVSGYKTKTEAVAPAKTVTGYKIKSDAELNSKEVSVTVDASRAADIFIENSSRPIEVKIWDQQKVKVVTTAYFEGDGGKVTDEEWFEKMNITIKSTSGTVRVKTGSFGSGMFLHNGNTFSWNGSSENIYLSSPKVADMGTVAYTSKSAKRTITIYVPKENKLDIESKYADVSVAGNVNKINVDISNGNLEMGDAKSLILRSKYGNVTAGNIGTAEIEFINGRFTAKDVEDLDIDTKYSTVELGKATKTTMRSTNDEYEFDEVGIIQGRKNYGNLRITKLTGSFDLDGTNADVKLRRIEPGVQSIKFDDKYADLRIPLNSIKNYNITFAGAYSSVYGNLDKKALAEKTAFKTTDDKKEKDEVADQIKKAFRSVKIATGDVDNIENHFTATGGDGKGTKIDIKCQNCTVDFK